MLLESTNKDNTILLSESEKKKCGYFIQKYNQENINIDANNFFYYKYEPNQDKSKKTANFQKMQTRRSIPKSNKENIDPNSFFLNKYKYEKNIKPSLEKNLSLSSISDSIKLSKNFQILNVEQLDNNDLLAEYLPTIESNFFEEELSFRGLYNERSEIGESVRSLMIDWMLEIFKKYHNATNRTFFKSVGIMNLFIKNTKRKLVEDDLHLIGIASMFLASKYEDIYHISMKDFVYDIGHEKFNINEVKKMEFEILLALDFNLSFKTVYNFLELFLFKIFKNIKSLLINLIQELSFLLGRMCQYWRPLVEEKQSLVAFCCILYSATTIFKDLRSANIEHQLENLDEIEEKILKNISNCKENLLIEEFNNCFILINKLCVNWQKFFPRSKNMTDTKLND